MSSNTIDTSAMLLQLRRMADAAGIPAARPVSPSEATTGTFPALLRESLHAINDRQAMASEVREGFEAGREDIELTDVMVAVQKARVSFEALTQVRNRMVAAYKEIMSMPL